VSHQPKCGSTPRIDFAFVGVFHQQATVRFVGKNTSKNERFSQKLSKPKDYI
jgi:hypothetical protein